MHIDNFDTSLVKFTLQGGHFKSRHRRIVIIIEILKYDQFSSFKFLLLLYYLLVSLKKKQTKKKKVSENKVNDIDDYYERN